MGLAYSGASCTLTPWPYPAHASENRDAVESSDLDARRAAVLRGCVERCIRLASDAAKRGAARAFCGYRVEAAALDRRLVGGAVSSPGGIR